MQHGIAQLAVLAIEYRHRRQRDGVVGGNCERLLQQVERRVALARLRTVPGERDIMKRIAVPTRDGGSGFVWSSDAGEEVTPIGRQ